MGSLGKVVVEDCFGVVQLYSDGSVYRASESEIDFGEDCSKNNTHNLHGQVEWEDCLFDDQHNLYLRVYKPTITHILTHEEYGENRKMAVVYYFHGGGFCLGSRTWPNCHNCCLHMSSQLQSIVISPDYRLAPENRLPAAIEDGLNAIKWLQSQSQSQSQLIHHQPWWRSRLLDVDGVNFDQVFVVGDSSGGNIAHQLAVTLGSRSPQPNPVRVRGYVLVAPFFGGSLRTNSEANGTEPILNLDALDRFWRLSLPAGESRDHRLANPFGPSSPDLGTVLLDPMLVIVGANEIMKDRIKDYVEKLKNIGKNVTYVDYEGQYHGFLTQNPCSDVSNQVFQLVKQFMFAKELSK